MVDKKKAHLKSVGDAVLEGAGATGLPGVIKTVYRMIGENQPSVDCLREAEDGFASAADADEVWDAALDMAACLRDAVIDPEPPEPPEPPPPPPPPPQPDRTHSAADVVLAALLVQLRDQGTRRHPVQQDRLAQ